MYKELGISEKVLEMANEVEKEIEHIFEKLEENCLKSSMKVLKAFQDNKVSTTDFNEITGYGYYDAGREKLEKIYADIFKAEDALVRPQIMSGTHALTIALFGLLKYGDTMISISGEPYDTLKSVIGLTGDSENSLIKHGIKYEQIELVNNDFDYEQIENRIKEGNVKLIEIQRSRGYSQRKSLNIDKIEKVIKIIKEINPEIIVMVDNCYGEFVDKKEPTEVGADLACGSLIKNIGGGLCETGGYIVGRHDLINLCAEKLTCPGIGKECGATLGQNRYILQGLFNAPTVVKSALQVAVLASGMMEELGFLVYPKADEKRGDAVQSSGGA